MGAQSRDQAKSAAPLEMTPEAIRLLQLAKQARDKEALRRLRARIQETGNEDNLLPLARAIDAFLSGEKRHIAILTPEVRGVAEVILRHFQQNI